MDFTFGFRPEGKLHVVLKLKLLRKKNCVTILNTLDSEKVLQVLLAKKKLTFVGKITVQVFHVDFKKKTRIVGRKWTRRRDMKRDQLSHKEGGPGAMWSL